MTGAIADSTALTTLADIELPIPPALPSPVLFVLAILAVAAVIAALLLWQRRSAAHGQAPEPLRLPVGQQALRRLATLKTSWASGSIDDREAGFRLCALLRLGLGLPQIDGSHPPAGVDDGRWRAFVTRLNEIRYRPQHPPVTVSLFEQAQDWLAAPSPAPGPTDV